MNEKNVRIMSMEECAEPGVIMAPVSKMAIADRGAVISLLPEGLSLERVGAFWEIVGTSGNVSSSWQIARVKDGRDVFVALIDRDGAVKSLE